MRCANPRCESFACAQHDQENAMSQWKRCRKKPIVVVFRMAVPGEAVATREGTLVAQEGDYIIRGVQGEEYPIGREIFESTCDVLDG